MPDFSLDALTPGNLLLRAPQFGRFQHLPFTESSRNHKIMGTGHIEQLTRAGPAKWIRAEHKHLLVANEPVEFLLVLRELVPVLRAYPRFIPIHPQPGVPVLHSLPVNVVPALHHPAHMKRSVRQIPFVMRNDNDITPFEMLINSGYYGAECLDRIPPDQRIEDDPDAEFIGVQARSPAWEQVGWMCLQQLSVSGALYRLTASLAKSDSLF